MSTNRPMTPSTRDMAEAQAHDLRSRFPATELTMFVALPIPADRDGRGVADRFEPISRKELCAEEAGLILLADDPAVLAAAQAAVEESHAKMQREERLCPGVTWDDLKVALIVARPA